MHRDASGYEIRKLFEEGPFNAIHDVSFGSIYPALTALLEREWVTCSVTEQDGRPDKKVYSISDAGRTAFLDAISATPAPDKMRSEMLFILSFGDHLDRGHVLKLIDTYILNYEQRLATVQECAGDSDPSTPVRQFVHDFGETMYQTAINFLKEHRDRLTKTTGINGAHTPPLKAAGGQR